MKIMPQLRKLGVVALAAAIGACVFNAAIPILNFLYVMLKDEGTFGQTFGSAMFLLAVVMSSIVGDRNVHVVLGLLGAVLFGVPAVLWQFVWKPLRCLHERTYASRQESGASADA
jgi:hypothetical protein